MTFTAIEYNGNTEKNRVEVDNVIEFCLFIIRRVRKLNLVYDEDATAPTCGVVRFTFSKSAGFTSPLITITIKDALHIKWGLI